MIERVVQADPTDEITALLADAAELSRAGNRGAAIATLLQAVQLAPDDRTAHRRLAATYALLGLAARARAEYDRYVERLETAGDRVAAVRERAYAHALLAPRPAHGAGQARRELTADQSVALRRVAAAIVVIAATLAAMLAAGAQIFARG